MKAASRFLPIVCCLLVLSAPAGVACEALGDWMAGCRPPSSDGALSHEMAGCSGKTSMTTGCCGSSALDAPTDLVLKRPGDGEAPLAEGGPRAAAPARAAERSGLGRPDLERPPRPPRYALLSALLL